MNSYYYLVPPNACLISVYASLLKVNTVLDRSCMQICGDDVMLQQHIEDTKDQLWQYYHGKVCYFRLLLLLLSRHPTCPQETPPDVAQKVNFMARYKSIHPLWRMSLTEFLQATTRRFDNLWSDKMAAGQVFSISDLLSTVIFLQFQVVVYQILISTHIDCLTDRLSCRSWCIFSGGMTLSPFVVLAWPGVH